MNKQDLIAKVVKDTGMTKVGAAAAIESFIDGITKSLKKGAPVTYVGFGTFKPVQRKARTARIQQTSRANTWLSGKTDTDWVYGYDAWTVPLAA